MAEGIRALLVYRRNGTLAILKRLLNRHGIRTAHARNCAEAAAVLGWVEGPDLVFTDTALTDGTWAEVENLAERTCPPVPVIVVSRNVDVSLYLDALEGGASDFIVPPFEDSDLDYVVKGALLHGFLTPSATLHAGARMMPEIAPNAQNHTHPRAGALHTQGGRQADGPLGGRT
jgi:DNA-binding NtrC family response regulator